MMSDRERTLAEHGAPDADKMRAHEDADIRLIALKLQSFLHTLPGDLDSQIFGDPALLMMLDLLAAELERRRLSIKSVCIGSGAPQSTALRYIERLEALGVVRRHANPSDRRSAHIALTPGASAQFKLMLVKLAGALRS